MGLGSIKAYLVRVYDKIIALLVLAGLVASLGYLGWHMGTVRKAQAAFEREIAAMRPAHPEAQAVDVNGYKVALEQVRVPPQLNLDAWSQALFVPEARVWCAECRLPVPYDAETCPFCRAILPIDPMDREDRDLDGDRMQDVWELAHGLNPDDPGDAQTDRDGDGFTNLEEFFADPQTDPDDPNSLPEISVKLCLEDVKADPFKLRFKSVIRMPNGNRQFAINTQDNGRTYFKKQGEDVEGFVVFDYEPRVRTIERPGMPPMRRDASILTLQRGDKLIRLEIGKEVQHNEYTAFLRFRVDDTQFELKIGDEFELRGKRYQLIRIDSRGEGVVIRRLLDNKDLDVRRCADTGAGSADAGQDFSL